MEMGVDETASLFLILQIHMMSAGFSDFLCVLWSFSGRLLCGGRIQKRMSRLTLDYSLDDGSKGTVNTVMFFFLP